MPECVLDGRTNLINTSGLLDASAHDPEIICRGLRMHRKPHQDRDSREHLDKAFADFFQKVLSSVVDPAAAKVNAKTLKMWACIPIDLDDVGGQSPFPCLVPERGSTPMCGQGSGLHQTFDRERIPGCREGRRVVENAPGFGAPCHIPREHIRDGRQIFRAIGRVVDPG